MGFYSHDDLSEWCLSDLQVSHCIPAIMNLLSDIQCANTRPGLSYITEKLVTIKADKWPGQSLHNKVPNKAVSHD